MPQGPIDKRNICFRQKFEKSRQIKSFLTVICH